MSHESTPLPPDLPPRPPDRFQFHLKHLLAYMFVCAIVAACIRYVLQIMGRLPDSDATRLLNVLIFSVGLGGVLYFFIRAPFLVYRAGQLTTRWRTILSHRQAMDDWLKAHKEEQRRIMKRDDE